MIAAVEMRRISARGNRLDEACSGAFHEPIATAPHG
jgi:hypothetical protein